MSYILDNTILLEVQSIKELQTLLAQDELQSEWKKAIGPIFDRLIEMGFDIKINLLDDLADISDMLLDAPTFLPNCKKHRVSFGKDGQPLYCL